MSFCPRCGAPTTASMAFCTGCGETLHPQGADAPTGAPSGLAPAIAPQAAVPAARGPTGKTMEPWLVVILAFVTLGIYQLVYLWRVSKEIDAYRLTPGHAHKPTRIAIILGVVAFVMWAVWFGLFLGSMGEFPTDGSEPTDEDLDAMMGSFALLPILVIVGITAFVFWTVGMWRTWSGIEAEERARAHPKPLSPGLQLVFVLVPYLNIVTTWVALYRTQDHLNWLWGATTPRP